MDKGETFKEGELEREDLEEGENIEFKTGEQQEENLEKEIEHIKEEQDKHALGFRDVETRKLNQEMQLRSRERDLVKEAEQQEDVVTSTGANLDKFKGTIKQGNRENPEQSELREKKEELKTGGTGYIVNEEMKFSL